MILKNSLFYLTIANLFVTILAYEKDEFYCKANEQMGFSICRRCPKLDGNCEELEPNHSCHCDNIEIFDKDSSKLQGRSDMIFSGQPTLEKYSPTTTHLLYCPCRFEIAPKE